ncbi:NADH dehydrogenase complex I, assembly factor 6 [Golovinomyces cichoracearum]|uniref:NADH dehydrogenase complex I, assembly factor 6 n=1 Tax=Golovinomyces cichoracearum TaxID=62708 RepID=A0A420IR86_9PEZI|nr:NADH dehydrogenase complex I, assembly factor 6 [Golovinomyces cichoracearum]
MIKVPLKVMLTSRSHTRQLRWAKHRPKSKFSKAKISSFQISAYHRTTTTDSDVKAARSYCSKLIQKFDSPSYTLQTFIPASARDVYLSIRALNVELARIPDIISNSTIGALRMQFWRDNVNKIFQEIPQNEPVSILLSYALASLRSRHPGIQTEMMKAWCIKIINAREQYMDNKPYASLDALETYAENTYSNLLYITAAALPMHSLIVDHVVSHIGKAHGITAVLRGLPLIAFPSTPNQHFNSGNVRTNVGEKYDRRQESVVLPLDIMAETGVKEEEVFRRGSTAPGLKDAVFTVATRANDHLLTAKEMLKKIKLGQDLGHEYDHVHEKNKDFPDSSFKSSSAADEIDRSFGVFMPAVMIGLWLQRLENVDFDIFKPELRTRDWRLPWKAYWAYSRRTL